MALVASPSSWTSSLPYAPHHHHHHHAQTPLRPQSATWNTKFPSMPVYTNANPSPTYVAVPAKPRLRLAVQVVVPSLDERERAPQRRFDPFADEPEQQQPVASTSQLQLPSRPQQRQNPTRGRPLTPLSISVPAPAPVPQKQTSTSTPPMGRRRSPSFSAGSGTPLPRNAATNPISLASLSSLTLASQLGSHAPSPAPSLTRPTLSSRASSPAPSVPNAPSPFHARHYPTPDARARLLARTLLNRIHAVGRPCSSASRKLVNGYESECGGRGYVPSRLSECTMAC